jgi:hypothetical protein
MLLDSENYPRIRDLVASLKECGETDTINTIFRPLIAERNAPVELGDPEEEDENNPNTTGSDQPLQDKHS